ncbi:MAG TPA: MoxR family ATPase [Streptosporangiaceae bacterium]|nr:MoxR family ATPase [Streptosporangiaceae bacterium]
MTISESAKRCAEILDEVERMIVGKREVLRLVLLGILAGGHVLLEDLPGLGKTMMARSFADVLGLRFTRIQFTPDLLPADVTGAPLYDQRTGEIVFRPGPVFTNLLLADEINRTPPKTQAALLEAMAEQQVTVDGQSRQLPQPFIVLATDNPIEYEGTYPLPEAQLDRFLLRTRLGYLPPAGEAVMLRQRLERAGRVPALRAVVDAQGLLELRDSLNQVHVGDDVLGYVVALLTATRDNPKVAVGASPRGGIAVTDLARGCAVTEGRDYVTPEDVKAVAVPALAHRLVLHPELWVRRISGEDIVADLLAEVPTPPTRPQPPEPAPAPPDPRHGRPEPPPAPPEPAR